MIQRTNHHGKAVATAIACLIGSGECGLVDTVVRVGVIDCQPDADDPVAEIPAVVDDGVIRIGGTGTVEVDDLARTHLGIFDVGRGNRLGGGGELQIVEQDCGVAPAVTSIGDAQLQGEQIRAAGVGGNIRHQGTQACLAGITCPGSRIGWDKGVYREQRLFAAAAHQYQFDGEQVVGEAGTRFVGEKIVVETQGSHLCRYGEVLDLQQADIRIPRGASVIRLVGEQRRLGSFGGTQRSKSVDQPHITFDHHATEAGLETAVRTADRMGACRHCERQQTRYYRQQAGSQVSRIPQCH